MKHIKIFESLNIQNYIVATMPEWHGSVYIFKTKSFKNDVFSYSKFFFINEDNKFIEQESAADYSIHELTILYQTNSFIDAKRNLIEFDGVYKNSEKYNL